MRAAGRVAIGVCTAHRPEMLRCCLAALASQILPEGIELTLVVADNEPEPNNQQAVEELAAASPFSVRYVHEPRRGISWARNAVLDACKDRFDWIAFTDDDCIPEPDWISALLEAAARYAADVVYGLREWVPPASPSFWFTPPKGDGRTEGEVLDYAATHNVLMRGGLAGLRFDERLAHGEDTDFFHRASLLGARIVYSAKPVVWETIPPHRATLRYQLRRRFHRDASRFYFERRHKSLGRAVLKCARRILWHVPVSICLLVAAPFLAPFGVDRFKRIVVTNTGRIVGTAGALAGLAGYNGNPYRKAGPEG